MAMWVEELRVDNFKICLREAKIFDGHHKGIKIVSNQKSLFLPNIYTSSKLNENHDDPWLKSSILKYLYALRCYKYIRGQLPIGRAWSSSIFKLFLTSFICTSMKHCFITKMYFLCLVFFESQPILIINIGWLSKETWQYKENMSLVTLL